MTNSRDVNTYTRYQRPDRNDYTEASHFSPTLRPFSNFKSSRKASISNKSLEGGQSIRTDTISREQKKFKPSAKRKNRFRSPSGSKPRRKLKSKRKSDHTVFKQMNEYRKKSGELRHRNLDNKGGVYRNENYGHPNHYEGSSNPPENDYYDNFPHEYTSTHQHTNHNLNLKSDRHDIDIDRHDVVTQKNKNNQESSKKDGEDYEYLYYYYYDYVYPDDDIAQSLGESGEWVSYEPELRTQDLSASQIYNGYEMLPTPLASNGTSIQSNSTVKNTKELKNENVRTKISVEVSGATKFDEPAEDETDKKNEVTTSKSG